MLSTKSKYSYPALTSVLIILMIVAVVFKPTPQYPNVEVTNAENIQVNFLLNQTPNVERCQQVVNTLLNTLVSSCPTCRIQKQQCLQTLTQQQKNVLSQSPLPYPSSRTENGVITYISSNANLALTACLNAEQSFAMGGISGASKIQCHPANTLRPTSKADTKNIAYNLLAIFAILATAGIVSGFICFLIIRYESLHAHLSHDHATAGPQKFHAEPTPRIGGLAILGGLFAAVGLELTLQPENSSTTYGLGYFLIAIAPAFLGGLIEDITKNVGVAQRLLLTMISGAIGAWLLGAVIYRLDIPILDNIILWLPFAVAFTIVAIGGVANSINIIDGYNGLAGGFSVIILCAMAIVAAQVNDNLILVLSVSLIGAILGFLAWNWPKGKIFMGDGGAYLVGFSLAELSVLLIYRNPSVSPWFPLLLLAYPVFETLFSIYRRKWVRKSAPGHPDARHLHQLIFKRIVRGHINDGSSHLITSNNSRVAPYIWFVATLNTIFAVMFWQATSILMATTLTGCTLYVVVYRRLTSFRGLGKLPRKIQQ